MIGLRRGTVRLVPHQPGWEAQAAETAAQPRGKSKKEKEKD